MKKYCLLAIIGLSVFLPTVSYSQTSTIENSGNSTITINGKEYKSNGNQNIRVKRDGTVVTERSSKKTTNKNTLTLECAVAENTFNIVLAKQNYNSESPMAVYRNGEKFLTFSKYKTDELSYSAYSQMRIGNQKLVANKVSIDRLSGEVLISQKVLSVFGGLAKSKNYNTFSLRGTCTKSVVRTIPQKF